MGFAGRSKRGRAWVCAAAATVLAVSACTSDGSSRADRGTPAADVVDVADGPSDVFSETDAGDADAAGAGTSMAPSTDAVASKSPPATTLRTAPPFSLMARSAAPKGRAIALLTGVQTGRHDGCDRVVFHFAGDERPGYEVEWVDGPVAAAGSGRIVDVAGSSRLRIVFDPASGVDLATGDISYEGPNRLDLPVDGSTVLDVVRSGDFEAVMTWVVGTDEMVPFRVFTLSEPTRVVVDVAVRRAR